MSENATPATNSPPSNSRANALRWRDRIALIVGLGGPLIGAAIPILWNAWMARQTVAEAEVKPPAAAVANSWKFHPFTGGRAAATWISDTCVADPSGIYATLLGGDTFWVWCVPATDNSQRATFEYTSVQISPVAGSAPPPPFDRARDVPISMGGSGYGYFLLFRRN